MKATDHGPSNCFQKQTGALGLQKLPYIDNISILMDYLMSSSSARWQTILAFDDICYVGN